MAEQQAKLTAIPISASNLFSGSIYPKIRYLKELRYLEISTNKHTGTIPTEVGTIYALEYISIANNSLFGTIPEELSNLVNLKSIMMADNLLRGSVPILDNMIGIGKKNIFTLLSSELTFMVYRTHRFK